MWEDLSEVQPPPSPRRRLLMVVLWPSFLMAGVLELLVFALVDPTELAHLDRLHPLPNSAVYTVAFVLFWAIVSLGAGISVLLATSPPAEKAGD
jgi:hypothetical protein